MDIPRAELEDWLSELRPYQANQLRTLIQLHGEEEAALLWLSTRGPSQTKPLGGQGESKPFFDRFKHELRSFICGDPKYDEPRNQLKREGSITKALLISIVSSGMGSVLGITATLVAPSVVIFLYIVGKIGREAFCANENDKGQEPSQ